MFKGIVDYFSPPTPIDIAELELEEAYHQLMQFETQELYNRKMAEYHRENIARLEQLIRRE